MFRLFASLTMVRRPASAVARIWSALPVLFLALYRSFGAFHDQHDVVLSARDVNDTNRPSVPVVGDRFAGQSLIGDDRRLRRVARDQALHAAGPG